jgi:ribosomal protein S18 acetylase RimI-like enzyme
VATPLEIRAADPTEAATLTLLAHAAKRHWGYPEEWIGLWRDELTITAGFIAGNRVYVAQQAGEIVGFCALTGWPPRLELEHLWVRPESMRCGIGAALLRHAADQALAAGARELEIVADPHAEDFYLAHGARRLGSVASRPPGRRLPKLLLPLT